jgi:hypothetical protein
MKDFLKHFINKPCTITTVQINYRFKEEHMVDYFMGIVEDIDEHGVLISHVVTKNKSYIFFPHIVSISEEQLLYDNNPEHAKIIEDYRKQKPITAAKTQITPPEQIKFVNPSALTEMAKKAKEAFDK